MNFRGTSYLNRLNATLPHLVLKFTDTEVAHARHTAAIHDLFNKCKPQDEEEQDRLIRAHLREQYIKDPKNK